MSNPDQPLRETLVQAAELAMDWATRVVPTGAQADALRQVALQLCAGIREGTRLFGRTLSDDATLPALPLLVTMSRGEMMALANRISLADSLPPAPQEVGDAEQARFLGALALSYAQAHDLPCVSALLRIGTRLSLQDPWLTEARDYLVDQQQPDGRFGLLCAVLRTLDDGAADEAMLRLQVEVLWALNEVASTGSGASATPPTRSGPSCSMPAIKVSPGLASQRHTQCEIGDSDSGIGCV